LLTYLELMKSYDFLFYLLSHFFYYSFGE